ncbi:MAG: FAD-binding oxidoreductase [Pseudomonadota bacterium]
MNDPPGTQPPTWYHAEAPENAKRPALKGAETADLCVIGAGFTGLSAALHAAKAGLHVIVLEARQLGFGASGRNGGQIGSGFNWSLRDLEAKLGKPKTKALFDLAEEGKDLAKHFAQDSFRPGVINAVLTQAEEHHLHKDTEHEIAYYGEALKWMSKEELSQRIGSEAYRAGALDTSAGFCNPVLSLQRLSQACEALGVQIFEQSLVHHLASGEVRTDAGRITAKAILLATNGYGPELTRKSAARVLPINNYIAVTEPLGARAPMSAPVAVADSRFVVNYFWQTADGRLLYGGGESYGKRFPNNIESRLRRNLARTYPDLQDVRFDYAWGGTLGITATRLPYIGETEKNVFVASGFSGHGLSLTHAAGKAVAKAIAGDASDLELLSSLPTPALPGGALLGQAITNSAMAFASLRDRLRS